MTTIESPLPIREYLRLFLCLAAILLFVSYSTPAQHYSDLNETNGKENAKINRARGIAMLQRIKATLEREYYDKTFHGIDLNRRFMAAEAKIASLETNSDIYRVIAAVLLEFNDSHTNFIPPKRSSVVEYGFTTQMIGNECVVTAVQKDSDAERKGLKPGDVIASFGKLAVTRNNHWEIDYNLYNLAPLDHLKISIRNGDGTSRELVIDASYASLEQRSAEATRPNREKQDEPYECVEVVEGTMACRLETFLITPRVIDEMMSEVSDATKLVLDLRGNGGGYLNTEQYLLGYFFDHQVKIGTKVSRYKSLDIVVKPEEKRAFAGELVVLVDSCSSSASEIFARTIQIQKRGTIVGDVTEGAVMWANYLPMKTQKGSSNVFSWAMNISVADFIMSDGHRLENVGVTPDYNVRPTRDAWLQHTDPVLAYAAGLLGAKLPPAVAGKFHFLKSRFENDDSDDSYDETATATAGGK
jgi:C-terminal peptidase prc